VTATICAADMKLEINEFRRRDHRRRLRSRSCHRKLVLAFGTDPVARWMYDNPHEYRCTSLDCSEPSEQARLKQGRRNAPATAMASPCIRGDDGPLEAVLAESVAGEKQADFGPVFEMTEHYRPTEPHWYLSLIGVEVLHRNMGCGAMRPGASPGRSLVLEPAEYLPVPEAWLRDRGYDPGRLVASHLSDAAPAALRTTETDGRATLRPMSAKGRLRM